MKKFLRENPTIAFGLGLPLVLVVIFLLVSGLPALLVDDPQYDVLYATDYFGSQNGVQISVVGEKVQVVYQGTLMPNNVPKLWRYNSQTGAVREISFILPSGLIRPRTTSDYAEAVSKTTVIDVPDLEKVTVDSSSIAPDGYEFSVGRDRYSGNVFDGLFYSSRYRNEAVLTKNGRQIRLPYSDGRYYNYNTHFIGWVISQ